MSRFQLTAAKSLASHRAACVGCQFWQRARFLFFFFFFPPRLLRWQCVWWVCVLRLLQCYRFCRCQFWFWQLDADVEGIIRSAASVTEEKILIYWTRCQFNLQGVLLYRSVHLAVRHPGYRLPSIKRRENGQKCRLVFPKAQEDVLKCLVLSTAQRYSVCCHRGGKKAEYNHI